MPWSKRGNSSYYYRSQWVNGRNRNVYVGSGRLAELAALADRQAAEEKKAKRERQAKLEELVDQHRTIVEESSRLCRSVLNAAMVASGYYQHKRQWRKVGRSND